MKSSLRFCAGCRICLYPSPATAGVSSPGKKAMIACLLCAGPFPGSGQGTGRGSHTTERRASCSPHCAGEGTKISDREVPSPRWHDQAVGTGTLALAAAWDSTPFRSYCVHLGPTMCGAQWGKGTSRQSPHSYTWPPRGTLPWNKPPLGTRSTGRSREERKGPQQAQSCLERCLTTGVLSYTCHPQVDIYSAPTACMGTVQQRKYGFLHTGPGALDKRLMPLTSRSHLENEHNERSPWWVVARPP